MAIVRKRPTSVGLLPRGRDYSIKDLGATYMGYTDLLNKELGVSLDADMGHTRWVQLHELSHVQHDLWTPQRIMETVKTKLGKDVSVDAIRAAADVRVNELLLRAVPDACEGFVPPADTQWNNTLYGYAATHRRTRALQEEIGKHIDPKIRHRIDLEHERVKGLTDAQLTVWGVVVPIALLLDELNSPPEEQGGGGQGGQGGQGEQQDHEPQDADGNQDADADQEQDGGGGKSKGKPKKGKSQKKQKLQEQEEEQEQEAQDEPSEDGSSGGADGEQEQEQEQQSQDGPGQEQDERPDLGDQSESDEVFGQPDNSAQEQEHNGCPTHDGDVPGQCWSLLKKCPWSIPTVLTPELTKIRAKGNFSVTTAESGRSIRWQHSHRLATDGMVFRRNKRRPGALQKGTVLIDVSGSMGLLDTHIAEMIELLPHATIAVYSGEGDYYRGNARGGDSWLVVVARNGRSVETIRDRNIVPRGPSNACDGPALLWLSRMEAPRLWVADGHVNSREGSGHHELTIECGVIMQAAGIIQISSVGATRRLVKALSPKLGKDFARVVRDVELGRVKA